MTTSSRAETPSESAAAAQQVWGKLLTHCGESYFYGGSLFDHVGMLSGLGAGEHPTVIEFRGVRFNVVPIRITDAERLNGMAAHARISMMAHLYRDDGGPWRDGPDFRPRNTDDIIGKAFQDVAGELGNGGHARSCGFRRSLGRAPAGRIRAA